MSEEPTGPQLFDLGAEQAVLGAMMLSPEVIGDVEGILTPGAFYKPAHSTIHRLITTRHAAKESTDPVSVVAALTEAGDITRVGGMTYVHDLVHAVPTAANGTHYARIVADRAIRRQVDERLRKGLRLVQQSTGSATELLDQTQQLLAGIEAGADTETGPAAWGDVVPEVLDAIEEAAAHEGDVPGVPTGLLDLDRLLNGLQPGQLIVIAGRPGLGKSVTAMGFAQHASWRHKLPVGVWSLEMTRLELGQRMLSSDTGVPLHTIKSGNLDDLDWSKITRVAGSSSEAPLWIDDTPSLTLAEIRNRARRLHRRTGGLALIVIDYLQLVETPTGEPRQVQVSGLSRGLKLLAKELNVPVVVVAQLNRGPEARTDKRPQLSDLRESGAIEQDADIVILVHRDDYYDKESLRAGEVDLIVAKHRNGPTDTITAAAQLHLSRFADMAMP